MYEVQPKCLRMFSYFLICLQIDIHLKEIEIFYDCKNRIELGLVIHKIYHEYIVHIARYQFVILFRSIQHIFL